MEEKQYKLGNRNAKICLITDLHFCPEYNLNILDEIKMSVKNNKPDYICLSGDIMDTYEVVYDKCMSTLKEFIKDLSKLGQVIVSLGNHDISLIKKKLLSEKVYKGNIDDVNNWFLELNKLENVYYINNKSLIRNDLCFIGYNPDFEYYLKEESKDFIRDVDSKLSMTKKYYNILLCHSPVCVFNPLTLKYSKQITKADLILSGHMHNGLILKCFDHNGCWGLISPLKKPFPKYARNRAVKKIDDKEINLIISGGIIKFSNVNPKIIRKFNCLFPRSIVYIEV